MVFQYHPFNETFRSYNRALKFICFNLSTMCDSYYRESDISLCSQRF